MPGIQKLLLSSLPEVAKKLVLDSPRSITVLGSINNAIKGNLKANVYVDKWPNFSAVVVQSVWPRISDVADISAYATCSEALHSVLTKGDLITWGEKQELQRIEEKHADFLIENLKCPDKYKTGDKSDLIEYFAVPYHYTLGDVKKMECPEGFFFDKLRPHHTEQVLSSWPFYLDWTKREEYVQYIVENYDNVAIFHKESPDTPVSFTAQYPCGQLGFGYVSEKYRRAGLFVVMMSAMYKSVLSAGFQPNFDQFTTTCPPRTDSGFVKPDFNFKYLQLS